MPLVPKSNIILKFTNAEKVARARLALSQKETSYRLKYPNGGVDPRVARPGVEYRDPVTKRLLIVCDCAGFDAWVSGYSRKQDGRGEFPSFPDTPSVAGGWINTDSAIEEAQGFKTRLGHYAGGRWFTVLPNPEPGCIVVYHSRSALYPTNPKVGHMGIVSQVPAEAFISPEDYFKKDTRNTKSQTRVIHCSGVDKRNGTAIRETDASIWGGKKALFLRFNGAHFVDMEKV
jgi:hypothetical protein